MVELDKLEKPLFGISINFCDIDEHNLKTIRKAGFDFVRPVWLPWKEFDPKGIDEFRYVAEEKYGKIFRLIKNNDLDIFMPFNFYKNLIPISPLSRTFSESFSTFLRKFSSKFKEVFAYQLDNEPNFRYGHVMAGWADIDWLRVPDDFYRKFLPLINNAVKETNSVALTTTSLQSNILLNSKNTADFIESVNAAGFDFLSFSYYPNYLKGINSKGSLSDIVKFLKSRIDLPLGIAETGHPNGPVLTPLYFLPFWEKFFINKGMERLMKENTPELIEMYARASLDFRTYFSPFLPGEQVSYIRSFFDTLRKHCTDLKFVCWYKFASEPSIFGNNPDIIEEYYGPPQERYLGLTNRKANYLPYSSWYYLSREISKTT